MNFHRRVRHAKPVAVVEAVTKLGEQLRDAFTVVEPSGAGRSKTAKLMSKLPHAVFVERVALLVAIERENRNFIFLLELESN